MYVTIVTVYGGSQCTSASCGPLPLPLSSLLWTYVQTKSNLVTPRNGEPLIAAIQDFITGE